MMNFITGILRCFVTNALTLLYSVLTLFSFAITYLKNPCRNPWKLNSQLAPPASLTDPKYGVHKCVKANNINLHYVEKGDSSKPLMLFLHGYPDFWYTWRHQLVEFSKDYWCVAVDMRGYGDSEKPAGVSSYKIDILVEDVRDLLRQLGRDKFILVSHDWGGLVANKFRDTHPETLRALIMLGSSSWEAWFKKIWSNSNQRKKSWYVFLFRMPCLPERMMQMNNLQLFDGMFKKIEENSNEHGIVECYKYSFGKKNALTPPINYYRANFLFNVPEKFKDDIVPMLVAIGQNDPYLSSEVFEDLKKQYKYIETTLVENCSHFLQQQVPEKVNKIIKDFLAKNNL